MLFQYSPNYLPDSNLTPTQNKISPHKVNCFNFEKVLSKHIQLQKKKNAKNQIWASILNMEKVKYTCEQLESHQVKSVQKF